MVQTPSAHLAWWETSSAASIETTMKKCTTILKRFLACKRYQQILIILAVLALAWGVAAGISVFVCRRALTAREYDVQIPGVEQPFTAVMLTDLHSMEFGENNETLLAQIRDSSPDVIFTVGDMISRDASDDEVDRFLALLRALRQIAPVYSSYGNHERDYIASGGRDLAPRIAETGAVLLQERRALVEVAGNRLCLGGTLGHLYPFGRSREEYRESPEYLLMSRMQSSGLPTIVLSHYPDTIIFVHAYEDWDIDLFLSGHTHGGVIRIPGIGGLYAPMQGWFPRYDRGYFHPGKIQLIISSGFAAHGSIPRVFNRPEFCVIHISPADPAEAS